ncbi:MAG: biopolymer transporter ExbD [Alteromonadaceae bacterium]|nr:MAG: biopolymer transporter ExbD [Alteromonadaceae bacterium]
MKLGRKRKRMEATVELNITAFMNLMVILVPFLLITAVFSRMTVLELNLPALDAKAQESKPDEITLQLQLLVTPDEFVLQDALLGRFKVIPRLSADRSDDDIQRHVWRPLGEILIEIKRRYPDEQSIALLLDNAVSYKSMIAAMDHVRSVDVVVGTSLETVVLFPNISIGDLSVAGQPAEPDVATPAEASDV